MLKNFDTINIGLYKANEQLFQNATRDQELTHIITFRGHPFLQQNALLSRFKLTSLKIWWFRYACPIRTYQCNLDITERSKQNNGVGNTVLVTLTGYVLNSNTAWVFARKLIWLKNQLCSEVIKRYAIKRNRKKGSRKRCEIIWRFTDLVSWRC